MSDENPMGQVIQIDEARIRDHLGEMVRGTVEETLNAMLDAEADQMCGAGRYERSQARQDTRAGSYDRTLQTSAGEVNLKVPKLRRQTFETAIIERYRRRESSVEEALIEMYLAGISVRRVEDITEALWGTRVSPSTVSNLNKKIYAKIEAWRNRRIEGEHPYLYLDGIVMKRTWAGEVRNVSLLVASAVNSEGFREILGICEGAKEDKSGWSAFLRLSRTADAPNNHRIREHRQSEGTFASTEYRDARKIGDKFAKFKSWRLKKLTDKRLVTDPSAPASVGALVFCSQAQPSNNSSIRSRTWRLKAALNASLSSRPAFVCALHLY